MFRKSIIVTALCASSLSLSGCSTFETVVDSTKFMVTDIYSHTKSALLRGPSDKSDVSFAKAQMPADQETYKTAVGEYVPASPETMQVNIFDTALTNSADGVTMPCPEGTYLTAENSCMSLETESYDFPADDLGAQFVDTGPVPCPEGTYLNAKNTCEYLEVEQYEFTDDVNMTEQVIDTSPVPCPEGTYLNAENACMFLEVEDFAAEFQPETAEPTFDFVQNAKPELSASP